jgi:hypothetical protein
MFSQPRTWRRSVRLIAAGGAVTLALGVSGVALAAVGPTPAENNIGSGGYSSVTTDAAGFTDGQEVVLPNQYSLTIATGAQGAKGCNSANGRSAAVALHSTNTSTVFEAQWAVFTAPGCPTNGPATGTTFPNLANIPFDHHVWVHWQLVNRVKTIKILVCILNGKDHKPVVPSASPSVALPTAPAGSGEPSASVTPTVSQPTASATSASPTVNPQSAAATPTETATVPAGTQTLTPDLGQFADGEHLPGFRVRCFIIKKQINKTFVLLQAQDLDAPVATPHAGDLPGPQSVLVPLPKGTVFDSAAWGATENTTAMKQCVGPAADGFTYPRTLAGPAGYVTTACQPANEQGYMTATIGTGSPQDPTVLNTTELTAPVGVGVTLVAPNNSLTATTPITFPHSTDPAASTAGGHADLFLGNAPVG